MFQLSVDGLLLQSHCMLAKEKLGENKLFIGQMPFQIIQPTVSKHWTDLKNANTLSINNHKWICIAPLTILDSGNFSNKFAIYANKYV